MNSLKCILIQFFNDLLTINQNILIGKINIFILSYNSMSMESIKNKRQISKIKNTPRQCQGVFSIRSEQLFSFLANLTFVSTSFSHRGLALEF